MGTKNKEYPHMNPMIKHPSAWIPMTMSLASIIILLVSFAKYGLVHEADEGTAAHLFQILMAGQIPIVAFFAIKWLPQSPKQILPILALQIGLALAALAPVFYFKL